MLTSSKHDAAHAHVEVKPVRAKRRYGEAVRALGLALSLFFATPALASGPVVVELYTSQGCEACPRANAVAAGLAARPDVLPLTFPVDFWDYLGWTDTLAKPEFGERQQAHRRALQLRGLQTPLVVINGRATVSGLQRGAVASLIRTEAAATPKRPAARFTRNGRRATVSAGPAPAGGAEVWLVRYDPNLVQVRVEDGANRGRLVPHRNVVRELVQLGRWTGTARSWDVPPTETPGLRAAVLVQAERSGRVLAAAVAD
jgi:hypothetical protein